VPAEQREVAVGGLAPDRVRPLRFGAGGELAFPLPGMSDVMPYPSSRYAKLGPDELAAYRAAWRRHLAAAIADHAPDVIHAHHVWLVSSLVRALAPRTPLVIHCHATGLRQLRLCPHLADEVRTGCARADRVVALSAADARALREVLALPAERVTVVGAGYRDELFHARGTGGTRAARAGKLLYVGKLAAAKGLPQLLDAVERLAARTPGLELHVAGSGAGAEAEELRARLARLAPLVCDHGQLAQPELAELMRRAAVCVLPSFYEGVPLVLAEAAACGCRLVATRLAGVEGELVPHLGPVLELVAPPPLRGADRPEPEALPRFVDELAAAIARALERGPVDEPRACLPTLEHLGWGAVFERVEQIWRALIRREEAAG
jgi:glycosyltransferase involved in cell wall biosynthesis